MKKIQNYFELFQNGIARSLIQKSIELFSFQTINSYTERVSHTIELCIEPLFSVLQSIY